MIIKIEWCENGRRGWLEYDGDVMIQQMPITNYKKWAKLFAKKDHKAVKKIRDTMKLYDRKYEILLRLL